MKKTKEKNLMAIIVMPNRSEEEKEKIKKELEPALDKLVKLLDNIIKEQPKK